jgi:two-component system response regulator DesR
VRNYLSNAMTKLGAANRHEAVAVARRMGWI